MRPSDGKISIWPVGVIGLIVLLGVVSVTRIVRLNSEPPSDFVALRASTKGANSALAAGYWDAAVKVIQWKNERTSGLPEQAPADFRLAGDASKANGEDRAARLAYWAKLREEWLKAENWHTTYSFDLSWMVRDAQSVWRAALTFFSNPT
jgi:hypothetical protein